MPDSQGSPYNHLLAGLSLEERNRLFPHLQLVKMPLGKALYESGERLGHVYFPLDCIVSLLYVMENGESAEITVVGNEGLVGVALFMGGETTPSRAIVQSAGYAYRLDGQVPKDEFFAVAACRFCCCVTRKLSSRRWPKPRSVIGIIQ